MYLPAWARWQVWGRRCWCSRPCSHTPPSRCRGQHTLPGLKHNEYTTCVWVYVPSPVIETQRSVRVTILTIISIAYKITRIDNPLGRSLWIIITWIQNYLDSWLPGWSNTLIESYYTVLDKLCTHYGDINAGKDLHAIKCHRSICIFSGILIVTWTLTLGRELPR